MDCIYSIHLHDRIKRHFDNEENNESANDSAFSDYANELSIYSPSVPSTTLHVRRTRKFRSYVSKRRLKKTNYTRKYATNMTMMGGSFCSSSSASKWLILKCRRRRARGSRISTQAPEATPQNSINHDELIEMLNLNVLSFFITLFFLLNFPKNLYICGILKNLFKNFFFMH